MPLIPKMAGSFWRDGRRKRRPLSLGSRFTLLLKARTSRVDGFRIWERTRAAGLSGLGPDLGLMVDRSWSFHCVCVGGQTD